MNVRSRMPKPAARKTVWKATPVLLAALALAGCSSSLLSGSKLFGGSSAAQPAVTVEANIYPANYRLQIARLLAGVLTDRNEFQNAMISPPALKQVPESANLHYVVCLQLNSITGPQNKVVIYLGGQPTQYVDSTPQECGDAAYQPYPELLRAMPAK